MKSIIYVSGIFFGALLLSGCGALKVSRDVDRLKSQISMLDQRVMQLEQSGSRRPLAEFSIKEEPSAADLPENIEQTQIKSVADIVITESATIQKASTRAIQEALKNAGFYEGAVDGKMGPLTRSAIREFQRANKLKVDGKVGSRTWGALSHYTDVGLEASEAEAAEIPK